MIDSLRLRVEVLKARLALSSALTDAAPDPAARIDRIIDKGKGSKGKGSGDWSRHPPGSSKGGQFASKPGSGSGQGSDKGSGSGSGKGWLTDFLDGFTGGSKSGSGSNSYKAEGKGDAPDWFGGMGGMKQPAPPAHTQPTSAKSVQHQAVDDKGRPVFIQHPTKPSDHSTWTNPAAAATFIPGGDAPASLHGVSMKPWGGVEDWTKVPGQKPGIEDGLPDLAANKFKHPAAGVIIQEPDGRVWITAPTNSYGGYRNTFPKGTQEQGLTLQQTAIKEAWEETGLKIEITGVLGDFERTTSVSRFYIARRVGGSPSGQGWESQAMRLVPPNKIKSFLNMPVDRDIFDTFTEEQDIDKFRDAFPLERLAALGLRIDEIAKAAKAPGPKPSKGGAWETQPRWPAGSPLGGQWKSYDGAGLVKPPKIGTPTNQGQQKKADAAYALAKAGDWSPIGTALADAEAKIKQFGLSYPKDTTGTAAYGKAPNSQGKWNQSLHQYLHGLIVSKGAAMATTAKVERLTGPEKLSDYKKIGEKPGGSNPGGVYTDKAGNKVLVKGANSPSDDRAKNEVLASKLMQAAGIGAPDMKLVDLGSAHGGGLGVAAAMVTLDGWSMHNKAQLAAAQSEFAVHAWLANYDAVGQPVGDNLAMAGGKVFNYDPGGALLYRAQGKPKTLPGGMLSHSVDEWQGMRNKTINAYAASVYGSMSDSQLKASAQKLAGISDATIKDLVATYGPGNGSQKAALAAALIARRDDIIAKAGAAPAALAAQPLPVSGAKEIEPGEKPDMIAEPAPKAPTAPTGGAGGLSAVPAASVALIYTVGLSNTNPGHNKFYSVSVAANGDVNGTFTMTRKWGKIGTAGQTKTEVFPTQNKAVNAAMMLVGEKLGKGYDNDAQFKPVSPAAPAPAPAPAKVPDGGNTKNGQALAAIAAIPAGEGLKDVLSTAMGHAQNALQAMDGTNAKDALTAAQLDVNFAAANVQPGSAEVIAAVKATQGFIDAVSTTTGVAPSVAKVDPDAILAFVAPAPKLDPVDDGSSMPIEMPPKPNLEQVITAAGATVAAWQSAIKAYNSTLDEVEKSALDGDIDTIMLIQMNLANSEGGIVGKPGKALHEAVMDHVEAVGGQMMALDEAGMDPSLVSAGSKPGKDPASQGAAAAKLDNDLKGWEYTASDDALSGGPSLVKDDWYVAYSPEDGGTWEVGKFNDQFNGTVTAQYSDARSAAGHLKDFGVDGPSTAVVASLATGGPSTVPAAPSGGGGLKIDVQKPTSWPQPSTANYYAQMADKMEAAYNAGDAKALTTLGLANAKGKTPWPVDAKGSPKTANGIVAANYHADLMSNLAQTKQAEAAEALKPVAPVPSSGRKGSAPALPDFNAKKLPVSNTNAASHNGKIDAIAKLAAAGDVKGILGLNYGTNTYGKQQAKLANDALAALGSPYAVDPGQKKNAHAALTAAGAVAGSDTLSSQAKTTAVLKPTELPPKVDFTGKSSKVWVNEANQNDYDSLAKLALAGDFAGVKNYQFAEINKDTGQPTGKMLPVSKHPSQHITNLQDFLVQSMDEKLNPPKPLEIFEAKMAASSVAALASKFAPAKLGATAKQFPSSQRIGHFIALGQVSNPEKLTPAKSKNYGSAEIAQASKDYQVWKNDPNAEKFRQLIQGHGGHEYHKGFDLSTSEGKTRLAEAKAAHKYARKRPAGTTVYKWENLSADTAAKLKSAQPGLILQNPAPACCSYAPTATKGFGNHQWKIIFAEGAKGLDSFGSGKYSGEKEVTMLPNHRFMVLEHKPNGPNGHPETTVLLLPPDPLLDSDYW
jgi:predicted DNA-binding WGR domain protein/8-oxo-dGTP pyrophosphatase MutT (NUDIX family)